MAIHLITLHRLRRRASTVAIACAVALGVVGLSALTHTAQAADSAVVVPAPLQDPKPASAHTETAVFAGGCFWGVQGVFEHVHGVQQVAAGYTGGAANTAQYETVGSGDTGHAESVRITYDPTQISYGRLLQIFFSVVQDPTELDYQGPDHGSQYRSAIFPTTAAQQQVAQAYIAQLDKAKVFPARIVTRVEAFKGFYVAERYHQNYLTLHPDQPYIAINDIPKVENLKRLFPGLYQKDAVLFKDGAA